MKEEAALLRMRDVAGEWPGPAGRVSNAGWLYLDDLSAVIAQQFGAIGAGYVRAQVKDNEVAKCGIGHAEPPFMRQIFLRDEGCRSFPRRDTVLNGA
jgi:hypothetical protein